MAVTHEKTITLINGEAAAIEPYRRVKYDGSTAGQVVYADASDGDSWIGVTLPDLGSDTAASGGKVQIALRHEGATFKMEAAGAISGANAAIYPANDGKIQSTGTVVIGTMANTDTAAGAGSIVEVHPNAGSGSAPDEEAIGNADGTTGACVPILLYVNATASGDNDQIEVPRPARKMEVVRAWLIARDTTAANVKLQNGSDDITTVAAKGTVDNTQVDLTVYDDTHSELAASDTLNVHISADTAEVDVYVLCKPLA